MDINGLQKLTLLDYPGHTACTIFLAGCNFRCPFCHNSELLNMASPVLMDESEFFAFLQKRHGLLDGVCITGGEPTLHGELPEFLQKIKDKGFKTKLDTNGTRPDVIRSLIKENLTDYIAMDIKSSPINYSSLCGTAVDIELVKSSSALIMDSEISYEFRTTVVAGLHTTKDFDLIGQWLANAKAYYLQPFVNRDSVLQQGLTAPTDKEMNQYLQTIKNYIPHAKIRGM